MLLWRLYGGGHGRSYPSQNNVLGGRGAHPVLETAACAAATAVRKTFERAGHVIAFRAAMADPVPGQVSPEQLILALAELELLALIEVPAQRWLGAKLVSALVDRSVGWFQLALSSLAPSTMSRICGHPSSLTEIATTATLKPSRQACRQSSTVGHGITVSHSARHVGCATVAKHPLSARYRPPGRNLRPPQAAKTHGFVICSLWNFDSCQRLALPAAIGNREILFTAIRGVKDLFVVDAKLTLCLAGASIAHGLSSVSLTEAVDRRKFRDVVTAVLPKGRPDNIDRSVGWRDAPWRLSRITPSLDSQTRSCRRKLRDEAGKSEPWVFRLS